MSDEEKQEVRAILVQLPKPILLRLVVSLSDELVTVPSEHIIKLYEDLESDVIASIIVTLYAKSLKF